MQVKMVEDRNQIVVAAVSGVSTGMNWNHFPRLSVAQIGQCAAVGNTSPCRLERRSIWLPSFPPIRLGLTQDKQLPSGAPNRRGNVETRRTRWLSRASPMAGSWSLAVYPRSYRPVRRCNADLEVGMATCHGHPARACAWPGWPWHLGAAPAHADLKVSATRLRRIPSAGAHAEIGAAVIFRR
jgi:hypothetical protein